MIKENIISFFPLNISLLPGEDIPLKVFEPKFKQLINECLQEKKSFGIPFSKGSEIQSYGCEVKIKQMVAKNSKGEMVITVEGIANFEITSFKDPAPGKLYNTGNIVYIDTNQVIGNSELMRLLIYYTDNLDPNFLSGVTGNDILQTDLAKALNLSSDDKYRFISIKDKSARDMFLLGQMNYLLKLREQEDLLNNDYYLN
jgi:ATP-dependent protease La (LON) substrate-binding domain